MTILLTTRGGMVITIDIKIARPFSSFVGMYVLLKQQPPALVKKTFMIPYGHDGIIPPFDFNNLEEGIHNILKVIYRDSHVGEFRQEDMVEAIDIMIMQEAPLVDIRIGDEYDVCTNVCV
ncbi:C1 [Fenugreek leaf curl betasatellite]|nr:C1 [Fenugreek leaf curl betasatellite]